MYNAFGKLFGDVVGDLAIDNSSLVLLVGDLVTIPVAVLCDTAAG